MAVRLGDWRYCLFDALPYLSVTTHDIVGALLALGNEQGLAEVITIRGQDLWLIIW